MLLFQDIGFWHDLVVEKMPGSRVAVPIVDPEFNVCYYLVCKKNVSKKTIDRFSIPSYS